MLAGVLAYIRRHHVAYLALFVALGGTAFALSKDSVGSRQIKDGQVRPQDLGLVKIVERAGPDSITSTGPAVTQDFTVKVPEPGLLAVYARTELQSSSNSGSCSLGVELPGSASTRPLIQRSFDTNGNYSTFQSAPGRMAAGDDAGTNFSTTDAGLVTFRVDPGKLDGQLVLSRVLQTSCSFRNTELHLIPLT